NVASQRDDPGSVLHLCRDLLALRRADSAGRIAGYQALPGPPGLWAYRTGGLTVLANFSDRPLDPPDPGGTVVLSSQGPVQRAGAGITLAPWQGVVTR